MRLLNNNVGENLHTYCKSTVIFKIWASHESDLANVQFYQFLFNSV